MTDHDGVHMKTKIILAVVCIGAALSFLTVLFVQDVSTQLWEQSIHTIMESTKQGCTTLRIQLQEAYEDMGNVAVDLEGYSLWKYWNTPPNHVMVQSFIFPMVPACPDMEYGIRRLENRFLDSRGKAGLSTRT